MDNYGYDDLILLVFDDLVTLTQVEIGLSQYDGDIAVVAYTGSTAAITPGTTIVGHTAATLSCVNGWLLIGSYADVVTGASTPINAGKRQFELVVLSACNSQPGGAPVGADGSGLGLTRGPRSRCRS